MIPDRTAEIARILSFWLEEIGPPGWYERDDATDATIRERFGKLWEDARYDAAEAWLATPDGALANLILFDQFPRNMFRGTSQAFATDGIARRRAKWSVDQDLDLRVPEPGRQFFYLPLMHSESLADQELCLRLVLTRLPESGKNNRHHSVLHREVIRRFGRFPSRNAPLGRRDTEAELAYRAVGGYMSA